MARQWEGRFQEWPPEKKEAREMMEAEKLFESDFDLAGRVRGDRRAKLSIELAQIAWLRFKAVLR